MIQEVINFGVKGHFTLVVSGPRGVRVYEAPNRLVNVGIDDVMSLTGAASCVAFAQIGTGTVAVAATDTALQNRIASTSTQQGGDANTYVAGPPDYIEYTTTRRFAIGALNSAVSGNFGEIGMGKNATGGLLSRALITDAGGSPTTISVLSDEQLDVIYRLRIYPIQTDITGSITLKSVSYDYTIRPSRLSSSAQWNAGRFVASLFNAGTAIAIGSSFNGGFEADPKAWTGAIGSRTSFPAGSAMTLTTSATVSPQAYTPGSFSRVRRSTFDLNDANGSIGSIEVSTGAGSQCGCIHQIGFSPAIPKIATDRLTLDFTYSFANRP